MSLKSKTFLVKKGEGVDSITSYLQSVIGLDSYLVKNISSNPLNDTVTQLTVFYQEYPDFAIDTFAPRQGAIIYSGVLSSGFDNRILLSSPVDPESITNGAVLIDNVELSSSDVLVDPSGGNYYLKVRLSGSEYQVSGFHEIRIDATKLTRLDGTLFDYSPVGGYTVNSLAGGHLGDFQPAYVQRRRGSVKVDVIRASKGTSPQQCIDEYLSQRGLDKEKLLAYTFSSRNDNQLEVFFVYIDRLEPQIIEGYPLNNTLIPSASNISNVTFVFSTKLDRDYLLNTPGLFTLESDFYTTIPISGSDIEVLDDLKTVRINLNSYLSADRIYSVVARPGIRSLDGVAKEKPEQWVLQISAYQGGGGSSFSLSGISGANPLGPYILWQSDPTLINSLALTGVTGLTITPDIPGGRININAKLATSSTLGVSSYNSNQFSITVGNVTVNESGLDHGRLSGLSDDDHTIYHNDSRATTWLATKTSDNLSEGIVNKYYSNVLVDTHLSGILSTSNGITGRFVGGLLVFSGLNATTSTRGVSSFSNTNFSVSAGSVSISAVPLSVLDSNTGPYVLGVSAVGLDSTPTPLSSATVATMLTGTLATRSALTGHTGNLSNPHSTTAAQVGAPTLAVFTGHTGDASVHYTQSSISVPSTQISDFTGAVQDVIGNPGFIIFQGSITGTYNGGAGTFTISGTDTYGTGGGGVSDHGALLGLADDDHTQYLNTTRANIWLTGNIDFTGHTGNAAYHYTVGSISHTGIQNIGINTHVQIDAHITGTSNPHSVTAAQVGSPTLAVFTGHTGTTGIHFTQSQISIPSSQISNFNSSVTSVLNVSSIDTLSDVDTTSNPPDEFVFNILQYRDAGFWEPSKYVSDHINDTSVHYDTASISITTGQVVGFGEAVQDIIGTGTFLKSANGVTGVYNHSANTLTLSGIDATTTAKGVATFTGTQFTVSNGVVSISAISTGVITSLVQAIQDSIFPSSTLVVANGLSGVYNDAGNTYSLSGINATTSIKGVASFNSANFSVSAGAVSLITPFLSGLGDTTITSPSSGELITYNGSKWVNSTNTAGDMSKSQNLSGLANYNIARQNLKVDLMIDDLVSFDTNGVWAASNNGAGSSYQYDPQYAGSWMQTRDCPGVVIASNGAASAATDATVRYHAGAGLYLASGSKFYFRAGISSTTSGLYRFGVQNSTPVSTGQPTNGIYFEFDSTVSSSWYLVHALSGVTTKVTTSLAPAANAFKWYAIEFVETGTRCYDLDVSTGTPIATLYEGYPNTASIKAMRMFWQCIGNGGTFRGIYMDKVAWPLDYKYLPTGLAL